MTTGRSRGGTSLVSRIVVGAHRRRALVLAAVAAVAVVSFEGLRRLSLDADVLSLLPQHNRVIQSFRGFVARFGTLDQLLVVFTAPDGHAIDEYGDDVNAWIRALRDAPEILRVDGGTLDESRDFGWLADRQLLLLESPQLEEALDRFTPEGMQAAIARSRDLLTLPSAQITDLVRQDPLGIFNLLRVSAGGPNAAISGAIGRDGYMTPDGRRRLVIAKPERPPFDTAFAHKLEERLRRIGEGLAARTSAGAVANESSPPVGVQFAGAYRIAVETESLVRREAIFNTVGSLAMMLPLLFVVFRSVWLVTVGALPSLLAAVIVLALFGFSNTGLSAAGTGAAAMLFGLGLDGVVLLYVAHRQALVHNEKAIPEALAGPSASMLLGMWTTAATFYGLTFVDFPSLQELGWLLGHSMVLCGVLTLVLVPALLPRRVPRRSPIMFRMPRLARWLRDRSRTIVVATGLLTSVMGIAATRLKINPTLDRLRSVTDAARLESEVTSAFGLGSDLYVVLAEGPMLEPLLRTNERLSRQLAKDVPGLVFQSPSRLLPSETAQQQRQLTIERAHLSAGSIRTALERAATANDFRPGAFEPFLARVVRLLDSNQRVTYDGYMKHGLADLIDRFIVGDASRWTLATYIFPVDTEQVDRVQATVSEVDRSQVFTGLTLVNRELARSFLPQFTRGLAIGTFLVIALVLIAFRDWRLSSYALLPTAVGLVWAAGALAMLQIELDLFAIFAVVTFIGVGVDYGVHLVHRTNERGDPETGVAELAPVIIVAASITMLGYGTLITSSYPPLRSIGLVSVVATLMLAVASLVLLPALLFNGQRTGHQTERR
jgi:predicted RND superfamily exporter protein